MIGHLILFSFCINVISLDLSFTHFPKIWSTEYPPVPNICPLSRSIGTGETLSQLEFLLLHLSRNSVKVYIEIHPASVIEFTGFLKLITKHIHNIVWMPTVVLYWPVRLNSSVIVDTILITTSTVSSLGPIVQFPLHSELHVAFSIVANDSSMERDSSNVYLCSLFSYKNNPWRFKDSCHMYHFDKPLFVSENFFMYNPVAIKRRNFNNATLNVVAQFDPDYKERISIRESVDGRVEFTNGMCLEILRAMQVSLNFSYLPLKGNGWVGIFPNGTWTGMAAQLIYANADLSIAQGSMVLMIDQLKGISFLHASSTGQFVALFRQPKASSHRNIVTSAFSNECLICYVITWGLMLATIKLMLILNKSLTESDLTFIRDSVLWTVSTACVMGWYCRPSTISLRIVCVIASCLAYCSYVAFSAEITVSLVTEVLPIRSFQQLSTSSLEIFSDKWLPIARNLIERIYNKRGAKVPTANSELYEIDGALRKLITAEPPIAFVTFSDAVSTVFHRMRYSNNFVCQTISSVSIASERTPNSMFVKRGSPLKEVLNYNVLMMTESGILSRLNRQYDLRTQTLCPPEANNYRGGLHLVDIYLSFLLLIGGVFLSIMNFIGEKIFSEFYNLYIKRAEHELE